MFQFIKRVIKTVITFSEFSVCAYVEEASIVEQHVSQTMVVINIDL